MKILHGKLVYAMIYGKIIDRFEFLYLRISYRAIFSIKYLCIYNIQKLIIIIIGHLPIIIDKH